MGAASERRYVIFAAAQTSTGKTPNQLFVADLNKTPKIPGARTPFGEIHFVASHGGWFAECPKTGFGYWFKTLRQAVATFRVAVFANGTSLIGKPF